MEGKVAGTQTGTMSVDTETAIPAASDLSQNLKGVITTMGMDVEMELVTITKTVTKTVK
jgi:hypothetical protein